MYTKPFYQVLECVEKTRGQNYSDYFREFEQLSAKKFAFFLKTGTDVRILKIILPKKSAKKLAFLTQNKAELFKNLIITLVFEKNANFLPKIAENCDRCYDKFLAQESIT
jgi:hypothetical protein